MDERNACALLKQRFEAAGYRIEENRPFEEQGVAFEIDGFDPDARVGYEYISSEAGDSWDVGEEVVAAMEARREKGEIHILFVDEANAAELGERADAFLAALEQKPGKKGGAKVAPAEKSAAKPAAAKKETAAKAKPAAKAAANVPAAKEAPKPTAKKATAKAPGAKPAAVKAPAIPAVPKQEAVAKKKPAKKA